MTPANVPSANVVSAANAPQQNPVSDYKSIALGDMSHVLATIAGIEVLLQTSGTMETNEVVCQAHTLLLYARDQATATRRTLDDGIRDELLAKKLAPPSPESIGAPNEPILAVSPAAIEDFRSNVCIQAGRVESMIAAALALIREKEADSLHKEIYKACNVLTEASSLADNLSGYALDVSLAGAA